MIRALAIVLSLAAFAVPAHAVGEREPSPTLDQNAAIEVLVTVVHARPAEGGVAPELEKLARYLVGSFPNHKSFTRLSTHDQRLAVGAAERLALPNGAELVYQHTGWKDGFVALHIEVGGMKSTVNVKDGGIFFQAGRAYQGGMIVLAFEVKSAP